MNTYLKFNESRVTRSRECPLRGIAKSVPAQHVKKSLLTIYMTVMMEVFSHSSWNGW
jgi:hypothetical protein